MASVQLWYTRHGGQTRGPFHVGLLRRYVLLGRLSLDDEVSHDKESWVRVAQVADLIPPGLRAADLDDPVALDRLLAAKRWADERYGADRRSGDPVPLPPHLAACRRGSERRAAESEAEVRYRSNKVRQAVPRRRGRHQFIGVAVAVLLAAVFVGVTLMAPRPRPPVPSACGGAPRPRVDWSNCRLPGRSLPGADLRGARLASADLGDADLSGANLAGAILSFARLSLVRLDKADLRGARLTGANLARADLSGADLTGADLSYADLSGARLSGATLTGAVLDNAIWIDGVTCAQGSRGRCLAAAAP